SSGRRGTMRDLQRLRSVAQPADGRGTSDDLSTHDRRGVHAGRNPDADPKKPRGPSLSIALLVMPIDVHAHALSERFLHDLQNTPVAGLSSIYDGRGGYSLRTAAGQIHSLDPHLHNLERRLTSLKSRGVTCQLFGPNPALLST